MRYRLTAAPAPAPRSPRKPGTVDAVQEGCARRGPGLTPPEHSPAPAGVWPGWTSSLAARNAHGRRLARPSRTIHTALFGRSYDGAKAIES